MENKYDTLIYESSHRPQVFTMPSKGKNHSSISEDEIVTQRLSPGRFIESDTPVSVEQSSDFYDTALRAGCLDSNQLNNTGSDGPVVEIDLNKLSAADEIMFETAHSVYNFTVTDPRIPAGRLIGGVLGNRLVDAALIPTRAENGRSRRNQKRLKAGSKFIFLIESGDGFRRLTTSRVTILLHKKRGRECGLIACQRAVTLEHVSNDESES